MLATSLATWTHGVNTVTYDSNEEEGSQTDKDTVDYYQNNIVATHLNGNWFSDSCQWRFVLLWHKLRNCAIALLDKGRVQN